MGFVHKEKNIVKNRYSYIVVNINSVLKYKVKVSSPLTFEETP